MKMNINIENGKASQKESSSNQSAKGKDKAEVNIASTNKTYKKHLCVIC